MTSNYLWDEFSQYGDVVLETSGTNQFQVAYTLANGMLLSQSDAIGSLYFLSDAQGSTQALTDGITGAVASTYDYDAFGNLQSGDELATKYLYTGQQYDYQTELYSLRARYYDPSLGRFMSRDTWAYNYQNPVELNRYVYAAGNPVRWSDPSGYMAVETSLQLQEDFDEEEEQLFIQSKLEEEVDAVALKKLAQLEKLAQEAEAAKMLGQTAALEAILVLMRMLLLELLQLHGVLFAKMVAVGAVMLVAPYLAQPVMQLLGNPQLEHSDGNGGGEGDNDDGNDEDDNSDFLYRAMSDKEWVRVQAARGLVIREAGTSELFVTPDPNYILDTVMGRYARKGKYQVAVEFELQEGTFAALLAMGATHNSAERDYPNLPSYTAGSDAVQIKIERGVTLTLGLGSSQTAVSLFNRSIIAIRRINS